MFEMSLTGEEHRDSELVTLFHRIRITDGASRLDNGLDAILGCKSHAVVEREECIRREHQAGLAGNLLLIQSVHIDPCCSGGLLGKGAGCLLQGYLGRTDPVHLTGSDTVDHPGLSDDDGIGLDMLDDPPGEVHILELVF